jgi:cell division initiation protein
MGLTPLDIQKMRFNRKLRGYDRAEVEEFLGLVAEELTSRLVYIEKLQRETQYYQQRIKDAEAREEQLHQMLVRAQKVAEEVTSNAQREAQLVLQQASHDADRIVSQAIDQSTRIESNISELRALRRELQLKLKSTLEIFENLLTADVEESEHTAIVRTLRRKKLET